MAKRDGVIGMIEISSPSKGTLYLNNKGALSVYETSPSIPRQVANVAGTVTNIERNLAGSGNVFIKSVELKWAEKFRVGKAKMILGNGDIQTGMKLTFKVHQQQASDIFPIIEVTFVNSLSAGDGELKTDDYRIGTYEESTDYTQKIQVKINDSGQSSFNENTFLVLIDALNAASKCYFNVIKVFTNNGITQAILKTDYYRITNSGADTSNWGSGGYNYGNAIRMEVSGDDPENPAILGNNLTMESIVYGTLIYAFADGDEVNEKPNYTIFPCAGTDVATITNLSINASGLPVEVYGSFYEFTVKIRDTNNNYAKLYTTVYTNTDYSLTKTLELNGVENLLEFGEVLGLQLLNGKTVAGLFDPTEGDMALPYSQVDVEIQDGTLAKLSWEDMTKQTNGLNILLPQYSATPDPTFGKNQAYKWYSLAELKATEVYHPFVFIPNSLDEDKILPEYNFPNYEDSKGTWYYVGATAGTGCTIDMVNYGRVFMIAVYFSSAYSGSRAQMATMTSRLKAINSGSIEKVMRMQLSNTNRSQVAKLVR